MKFDSDNSNHINLLNVLCNKAAGHFDKPRGLIYYSDCLRDVEVLMSSHCEAVMYWIVGETHTVLMRTRESALDLFHKRSELKAVYTVTRRTTEYGTTWFSIELTD